MRFSIITVTKNAESHLESALQSTASQDFKDFEHLLWDGGSTDRTLEIAARFPHVKLYQGKDSGIADAMNKGAQYAQGEILLHLHADDLLEHSRVLSMVNRAFLQHPDIQWLYGQAKVINGEGNTVCTTPFEPFSARRLRRYNFITHPATYIKRALFEKVRGFQTHLRYAMDYDLWLRLALEAPPLALPHVFASFRAHPLSLSTQAPLAVTDEAYRVRNCYTRSLWERFCSYRTWKRRRMCLSKEQ